MINDFAKFMSVITLGIISFGMWLTIGFGEMQCVDNIMHIRRVFLIYAFTVVYSIVFIVLAKSYYRNED